ncbi:ABC transporter substrate-binding protein [Microbacterium sp. EYE_5]|uniref:ABC transporter substrate-binding protein n=1 Tax=unclassified Microbacterium TaxID=2609290 RepID=UPI0020045406|nr:MULTISPECIES: ABC transporter substrate-binding protein [unclassified Microbacterium]MCK6079631.1 ABC transporter substrate-binding protein [Microbacterium sp. EYE_382]MCK6084902.1 ABC transporter substrate-binding protein [Microbacterium sp. EYE_384]MCK6122872.1 ABC transporter substrate-binding protein [Microbacterium sp. EYE_80]MCK6125665.1 ABC transporter substrate-binding protein [Microbacterium sp. EYE_79]MCK6140586.1 ABC transporter substrate-binding protein [Microbacterium sp. EYE_3
MKKSVYAAAAMLGAFALAMTGCAGGATPAAGGGGGDDVITIGFAQTGSESGWRAANTESMKSAFSAENGFELIFNAADNKQEAQISAVRNFINQGVDAIVIAPITVDGWDDVLTEAKDAGIPVVLEDRTVSASEDLYASWVGLDFEQEGRTAGEWVKENFDGKGANLVVLEGTTGSSAALDRATGFDEAIAGTDVNVLDSQTGDFTRDGGKKVMEGYLQKYGKDINVLFAHNDDMGLGALDAIKAAGLTPGKDIQIVTIDAVKDGMTALANGEFNFIVECNPLLGDKAAELVKAVVAGDEVEKRTIVEDQSFTPEQAAEVLDSRPY